MESWTWKDFSTTLCTRFGGTSFRQPGEALAKLQKKGLVLEYQDEFERLANFTLPRSEQLMVDCFISGLREDIRNEVKMLEPTSLVKVTGQALMAEEKITSSNNYNQPIIGKLLLPSSDPLITSIPNQQPINKAQAIQNTLQIRKLTPKELAKRRNRGLCFNCDENFQRGHQCKTKQLFLMEGDWLEEESDNAPFDPGKDDNNGDFSTCLLNPKFRS